MKLYELEPNTATVAHPEDPDVQVDLIEPEIFEYMAWKEKTEKLATQAEQFAATLEMLAKYTKAVRGLQDREGNPIVLQAPIPPDALRPLVRQSFAYKTGIPVKNERGEPIKDKNGKEIEGSDLFTNLLLGKLLNPETFSRPLEPGPTRSTTTSTSASA